MMLVSYFGESRSILMAQLQTVSLKVSGTSSTCDNCTAHVSGTGTAIRKDIREGGGGFSDSVQAHNYQWSQYLIQHIA
jgi:hypothetical protein